LSTVRPPDELREASPPGGRYHRRMSSIYDLEMTSITGEQVSFDRFRDQVLLIVNVASA
jgi:hypothetical protein